MKRIAILFHESDKGKDLNYLINRLSDIWSSDGIDVEFVFGTRHFIPADLAILHIDLSIVPDSYLRFADKYPIVLNKDVKNICKSTFMDNMIKIVPGDNYRGRIIVKSNLNYAGNPERNIRISWIDDHFSLLKRRLSFSNILNRVSAPRFNSPSDYIILESPSQVPKEWFKMKDIVIQKFLPEKDQRFYYVRNYYFLGDRHMCLLRKGSDPIVNASSTISLEPIEVHPEIIKLREKLHFDYGKFDYAIHEGFPVLFDINKTTGASPNAPFYPPMRNELAKGIYSFFS